MPPALALARFVFVHARAAVLLLPRQASVNLTGIMASSDWAFGLAGIIASSGWAFSLAGIMALSNWAFDLAGMRSH